MAGWSMGGGHGVLSGVYGMGADNIMQASIVTPKGQILIINECQHSDLFWAIRGGGGGTFGVILSLTIKTYPTPSLSVANIQMRARDSMSSISWWTIVAELHKDMIKLQDLGVMGYYTASGPPYNFQYTMFQPNTTDVSAIELLIAPLRRRLETYNETVDYSLFTTWMPVWYSIEKLYPTGNDAGVNRGLSISRLLPRKAIQDTEIFAKTLSIIASRPNEMPVRGFYFYASGINALTLNA